MLSGVLAGPGGCVRAPDVRASPPTTAVRGEAVREAPAAAPAGASANSPIAELAARGVFHDDFARGVLYTWTTARQVEALREAPRLLVAEGGAGTGPSPFLRALAAIVAARGEGHELAELLLEHPALRRRHLADLGACGIERAQSDQVGVVIFTFFGLGQFVAIDVKLKAVDALGIFAGCDALDDRDQMIFRNPGAHHFELARAILGREWAIVDDRHRV